MKNKNRKSIPVFGLACFALILVLFGACTSATEKEGIIKTNEATKNLIEAKKDLNKAQENYAQMYKEFKIESDKKILENERAIAQLKAEAKIKNIEAKADLEKKLIALEQKNQLLKEKVRDYKEDDLNNWELFKIEFNNDLKNLEQSLKDLGQTDTK